MSKIKCDICGNTIIDSNIKDNDEILEFIYTIVINNEKKIVCNDCFFDKLKENERNKR